MNFIFKILTFIYSVISYLKRKVLIKNIRKEDLVLDVGSGDKPFWRADVIVDKYLEDNQQRHTGSMLYDKRKIFIEADVEQLPFKDKVFDFVFCSHLLEHVKNPDKAISELTRVGKRGYIEVPSAILDLLKPFPPHLWFCEYKDNALFFKQKEKEKNFYIENIERLGKTLFEDAAFQYLLDKYYESGLIGIYWQGKIKFKIIRAQESGRVYTYKKEENFKKSYLSKARFLFYRIFYEIIVFLFYKKKAIDIEKIIKSSEVHLEDNRYLSV